MRLRVTFSKQGALRYIGHLDLQQIWERTIRRAGLSPVYSQGFHPSPKIHIAAALPLGFIGREELVDLWLQEDAASFSLDELQKRLQQAAPPGLTILHLEPVEEHAPALQTQVVAAEYEVRWPDSSFPIDLKAKVAALLDQPSLPRERRGKRYDLRPLILVLEANQHSLRMLLSACEGATGRPEEVLAELDLPFETARIERIRLILARDRQPLPKNFS
ncbi:MAG: TIGR03936 family radical SAM-associated protein [Anaerolineales bacterium]|nr:TIGR03936 family radical SAM-associated protein [Anaerolineales bacterium]MCX7609070.1 TIGR03936 family radical SAM-associated protein [Anaerolineales bacterium]